MKINKKKICKEEGKIFPSWRKNKKKVVCFKDKLIHFGDKRYKDFTQHKDKKRRKLFRARHKCSEKEDKTKAGYYACKELW